ncbi:urease accessory protein UreE [Chitinophaga pinensis]|uniref:Urease accessory protein UreE n=1 Tax=Chitinophaga pinensis (strain ATCC 43595 / DSM 2588 / LMG 13176 / NBRC 15968 / NCIMB 11800 / UQM 2034) TaxID=485918 RepID=A0A979GMX0_CHIPD|nr:urease accessory protein UreE [Chitinophaga pinensis]ACU58972.1 UreE urease accessory domain protein [Chitinophaga pinensis DSM 2588]
MIIIEKIEGNIVTCPTEPRITDPLQLEWFETGKRVLRRYTLGGQEIALRFMREAPMLQQGDIVWMDDKRAIVVSILPAQAIVLRPATMTDMAVICYEIGNKHLPLFLDGNEVLVPYEEPLFRWLEAKGYAPAKELRTLTNMLRSNVIPHEHGGSGSLFSKIMQLAGK